MVDASANKRNAVWQTESVVKATIFKYQIDKKSS